MGGVRDVCCILQLNQLLLCKTVQAYSSVTGHSVVLLNLFVGDYK
jgi:hypothetical protein